MNAISTPAAGAISIALIVGLGIFVYPWLLAQRHGSWVVALMTLLRGALFLVVPGSDSSNASLAARRVERLRQAEYRPQK